MKLKNSSDAIDGLGILCLSAKFLCAMKTNYVATVNAIKQSRMENTFSYDSARVNW